MSIINDALKKTQEKMDKQEPKSISSIYDKLKNSASANAESARGGPPSNSNETKAPPDHSRLKLMLFIMLALAGVAAFIYRPKLNQFIARTSYYLRTSSVKPAAKKAQPVVKREIPKNGILLSGVMMMDNRRVALINDGIYEVGEFVNGKKIVNITLEQVDFLENGKIATYSVRHP